MKDKLIQLKNSKLFNVLIVIFVFIFVGFLLVNQQNLKVKGIDEKVAAIEKDNSLRKRTFTNDQFIEIDSVTDNGQELIVYYKDNQIKKLEYSLGLSFGVKKLASYFDTGKVFYVHETEQDFPVLNNAEGLNYEKLNLAFEGWYYFDNNKLIKQKTIGKKRFEDDNKIDAVLKLSAGAEESLKLLLDNENKSKEEKLSSCLMLLEQVNASLIDESEWEAVEIDKVNEEKVSLNNLAAKKFQEASRNKEEIQANYGPFIMEKTKTRGGEIIQETNPELIKCAQDRIIISIWQPK